MKKNLFFSTLILFLLGASGIAKAQLTITDHEGNEYEYAKMSDGRNWMLESMRATTDRNGNPLRVYWRSDSQEEGGYATQDEAAFSVGYAYLREQVLGAPGESRTYSARPQSFCPNGWHVPEYIAGDPANTTADYNALITAYGGNIGSWLDDANWAAWRTALRLTPDGYYYGKFQIDPTTKEVTKIMGYQMHLMTSGHYDKTKNSIILNVGGGGNIWGGIEENADYAAYCRCVENLQSTVTFKNFSTFGVDISFSEALQKNYAFAESVTVNGQPVAVDEICPRNFLVKEHGTGVIIPVDEVFMSVNRKEIQLSANFDESKIYELTMVDAKLREQNVPYGGYTFNGGRTLYFPVAPSGINTIENLDVKVNTIPGSLVIEQFGAELKVNVYSVQGTRVLSQNVSQGISYLNIAGFAKGIYMTQLTDVTGYSIVKKFIVK